jgi:Tfp pilus assembly protein PilO
VNAAKRNKLVAIGAGVLAVLILGGGWFLLVSPKRTKAADLQAQIDTTQSQIAIALAQSHTASGRADRVRVADLYRLSRAMPDRVDIAGVLLDLGRAADRAGVKLSSITPQAAAAPTGGYESVPIRVEFQGRYEQLTKLLGYLRRLVTVRNGSLSAGGRLIGVDSVSFAAGEAGLPQVKASLALEAYVFSPTAPAGDATSGGSEAAQPDSTSDDSATAAGAGSGS